MMVALAVLTYYTARSHWNTLMEIIIATDGHFKQMAVFSVSGGHFELKSDDTRHLNIFISNEVVCDLSHVE